MEINRELATVRRIRKLIPHSNADRLEIALIDGWQVVVQKGLHQEDDLIVYFEIDSFLPLEERYEFLRKNCFKSTKNIGDGFRIKTIRLRGEISQGLIMPFSDLTEEEYSIVDRDGEGCDLTEVLKVKKYEKPEFDAEGRLANLAGKVKGYFPSFIPKTDQPRIQNFRIRDIEPYLNDTFECTIKLDGSSMTVFKCESVFGVCSRNYDLKEDEENTYWQISRKLNLEELVGEGFAIQGEVVGPGINKNHARLPEHDFYIFDIWDIKNHKYLTPDRRILFCNTFLPNIKHVPVLFCNIKMPTYEEALEMADNTKFNNLSAEGIVFKSNQHPHFSFKTISNKYLLKTDED